MWIEGWMDGNYCTMISSFLMFRKQLTAFIHAVSREKFHNKLFGDLYEQARCKEKPVLILYSNHRVKNIKHYQSKTVDTFGSVMLYGVWSLFQQRTLYAHTCIKQ